MKKDTILNIIVISFLLLTALLCLKIFITSHNDEKLKHDSSAVQMVSNSTKGDLIIPAFSKLIFEEDGRVSKFPISNPAGNDADMYVTLTVDEKEIYKSGLIKPGECIKEIILDNPMESGSYDCVAFYHFNKDGVELNGLKNKCKLGGVR